MIAHECNRQPTVRVGLALAALSLAVMLPVGPAAATILSFGLDVEFSGGTAPASGTQPWVSFTLDDSFGDANTVRLTMSADNLTGGTGGENIDGFYFNFDPLLDPTLLTFTVVNNAASTPNSINTGVNAFMADGDGSFDIFFDFPPPPGSGAARFTGGEVVIYDITYTSAISASSFIFPSEEGGGNGSYLAAAHILRTGDGTESGWIGVSSVIPEPQTGALLGIGLALLGLRRKR